MTDALTGYAVITALVGVCGLYAWLESASYNSGRKTSARIAISCWAWPLLLIVAVGHLIHALWKDARP